MEGLRHALIAPAAGTAFMIFGWVDALMAMIKIRYAVVDDNGKKLLDHPYKPWLVAKGKEKECEDAFRAYKMYENVKEWTLMCMPLMWTFALFGGAIPYVGNSAKAPWLMEAIVAASTGIWLVGNNWYITGYLKNPGDRLKGFYLRTNVFRFWLGGTAAGIVCSALERFGVALPGK